MWVRTGSSKAEMQISSKCFALKQVLCNKEQSRRLNSGEMRACDARSSNRFQRLGVCGVLTADC